jgi:hypothetical protein
MKVRLFALLVLLPLLAFAQSFNCSVTQHPGGAFTQHCSPLVQPRPPVEVFPAPPPPAPAPPPVDVVGTHVAASFGPNGELPGQMHLRTPYTLDFIVPHGVKVRITAVKDSIPVQGTTHVSIDGGAWELRGEGYQAPAAVNGAYPSFAPGFHRIRVKGVDGKERGQFVDFKPAA